MIFGPFSSPFSNLPRGFGPHVLWTLVHFQLCISAVLIVYQPCCCIFVYNIVCQCIKLVSSILPFIHCCILIYTTVYLHISIPFLHILVHFGLWWRLDQKEWDLVPQSRRKMQEGVHLDPNVFHMQTERKKKILV